MSLCLCCATYHSTRADTSNASMSAHVYMIQWARASRKRWLAGVGDT